MATGKTTFGYANFNSNYEAIKNAVGSLGDADNSTIGGVINTANRTLANDLAYAEDSAWASSKMAAWEDMYPSLVASFQKCISLLDVAKATADDYQAFEQSNQGIR